MPSHKVPTMPKFEYILAPSFLIDPNVLPLGSIFSDLDKPTDLLNQYDRGWIPTDSIRKTTIGKFTESSTRSIKADGGLNANIAQGIGGSGDVIFTRSKSTKESYSCSQLDTESFEPDEAYVQQSMTALDVQEYLGACALWNKKVFMVTGLKIAKDLKVGRDTSDERGGTLNVGVDATALGVPAGVGLSGSATPATLRSMAYEAPPIVVFAFRVIQIKPKGRFKTVTTGALYNDEDEDADSSVSEAGWDMEDTDARELSGDFAVVQVDRADVSS